MGCLASPSTNHRSQNRARNWYLAVPSHIPDLDPRVCRRRRRCLPGTACRQLRDFLSGLGTAQECQTHVTCVPCCMHSVHCVAVSNAMRSMFGFWKSLHARCNSMQEFGHSGEPAVSFCGACHHDYEGSNAVAKISRLSKCCDTCTHVVPVLHLFSVFESCSAPVLGI